MILYDPIPIELRLGYWNLGYFLKAEVLFNFSLDLTVFYVFRKYVVGAGVGFVTGLSTDLFALSNLYPFVLKLLV